MGLAVNRRPPLAAAAAGAHPQIMPSRHPLRRLLGERADLSELFHRQVVRGKSIDLGEIGQRVVGIAGRLNQVRAPRSAKRAYVVTDLDHVALTVPGRHVYVSHRLARTLEHDDALAFVIAHEMAHHDLHHLVNRLATVPATMAMARVISNLGALILGPERELAADARGMGLCLQAGYDRDRCLTALELFLGDEPDLPWWFIRSHPPVAERLARLRGG